VSRPFLSIVTPTWNRAYTLARLADSIAAQGSRDFEWILVDDGSTDETPELAEALSGRGDLPAFLFRRKPNGGKHTALNEALELATGEYVLVVDSDDALPPDAVERIARALVPYRSDPGVAGLVGLRADPAGAVIGDRFPEGAPPRDLATISFRERVGGDKAEVVRLEVLKRYPFPVLAGERFLGEGVVWHRMAFDGLRFATVNDAFYLCDYRPDGLSARSLALRIANPKGTLLYYGESLKLDLPPGALVRQALNLARFAAHAGFPRGWLEPVPGTRRHLARALVPAGAMIALLDRLLAGFGGGRLPRRRPAA